jgi:hypothetical protein
VYGFGHRDLYTDKYVDAVEVEDVSADQICPAYDQGEWLYRKLHAIEAMPTSTTFERLNKSTEKNFVYKNAMWTGVTLYNSLEANNDITVRIRVSRPYMRWTSTTGMGKTTPENNNMPLYRFSTKNIATLSSVKKVAQTQMDSIYITPNPYYGISTGGYEESSVDTRVKIVNLPKSCKISIYTTNGTLIRRYDFNSPDRNDSKNARYPNANTFWEWDLKNSANIPIASGLYLIHIIDNEYGTEKTLKFLCIQRPVDVNAF